MRQLYQVLSAWRVYHFHDTSAGARVKQMGDIHQNEALLEDDGNLPAYLYLMREKHPGHYLTIVEHTDGCAVLQRFCPAPASTQP